jgi:hypothetical protein
MAADVAPKSPLPFDDAFHKTIVDNIADGVPISAGIAFASPGSTPESLIRNADLAMYDAKRAGGNGLRVFDPEMLQSAVGRLEALAGSSTMRPIRGSFERDLPRATEQPGCSADAPLCR